MGSLHGLVRCTFLLKLVQKIVVHKVAVTPVACSEPCLQYSCPCMISSHESGQALWCALTVSFRESDSMPVLRPSRKILSSEGNQLPYKTSSYSETTSLLEVQAATWRGPWGRQLKPLAKSQQLAPTASHVSGAILEFSAAPVSQLTPDEAEKSPVNAHYHENLKE